MPDEIFGGSGGGPGELGPWYSYGLMGLAVPGWALGTLVGVMSGNILPAVVINALGIAIYGMFIAVVLPAARKDRAVLGVAVAAMILSCLFYYTPVLKRISSGMQVILITLAVAGTAAWLFPRKEED